MVDVRFPKWLLDAKGEFYTAVRYPEFPVQIAAYLATLKPGFPRTIAEMIERSDRIAAMRPDGAGPNPPRWNLFKREAASGPIDSYRYTAVRDHALPLVRATLEGVLTAEQPRRDRLSDVVATPGLHQRAARAAGRRQRRRAPTWPTSPASPT